LAQVARKLIISTLQRKGFAVEETPHHTYLFHERNGKETGGKTYLSRGSKSKFYDSTLLNCMKKQLKLDSTYELMQLLKCPMDKDQYSVKLAAKGF